MTAADPRIQAIAEWIMAEVEAGRLIYQEYVVRHVSTQFGDELLYRNANHNWALDKRINEAFKKLSGDRVVWIRSDQAWRLRRPTDKPGRMQS